MDRPEIAYPRSVAVINDREAVAVNIVLAALRKHDTMTTWALWPKFIEALMAVLIDMDAKRELVSGEIQLRSQGMKVYKYKRAGISNADP